MTPLPIALGGGEVVFWRIDRRRHAATWDSGKGAFLEGGRWNTPGERVVYAALDPATAILEVAVHKGFHVLDTDPHVLTSFTIDDPSQALVVQPDDVPNPNWLRPGYPSAGQQEFGAALLEQHPYVVLPSVVSTHSWNMIMRPTAAHKLLSQEPFALDPRLNRPRPR